MPPKDPELNYIQVYSLFLLVASVIVYLWLEHYISVEQVLAPILTWHYHPCVPGSVLRAAHLPVQPLGVHLLPLVTGLLLPGQELCPAPPGIPGQYQEGVITLNSYSDVTSRTMEIKDLFTVQIIVKGIWRRVCRCDGLKSVLRSKLIFYWRSFNLHYSFVTGLVVVITHGSLPSRVM